ncbi:hypothetical protein Tco_1440185 [Tanacetum coccineum]
MILEEESIDNAFAKFNTIITSLKALDEGSGYQQKDRKPSQNDKTKHGMEKTVQNQGQSPKMPKSESILRTAVRNRVVYFRD